ncbi:MAG: SRPBCC family protein [bacterium]|nr:SRPBCC family protein [bacterium]
MSEITVIDEIGASADSLWELASAFGDLSWLPSIESCSAEGEGVGSVRTIMAKGSPKPVQERLDAIDPSTRTYTYSFVGESPLPCENYQATVKLVDLGADRCRIEWRGSFEPAGLSEEQLSGIFEAIYRGAIAAYKDKLEKN